MVFFDDLLKSEKKEFIKEHCMARWYGGIAKSKVK